MNANFPQSLRRTGLLAGAVFSLAGVSLVADPAATSPAKTPGGSSLNSDAFPIFDNYIKVGVGAPDITGDKTAFQERFRQPYNGFAGIEDMHYAKDLAKDTTLTIDGRVLAGSDDYLGKFLLAKTDVGTFETGYQRFRTFYDGVGGFFPTDKAWAALGDQNLHTDRAKFWVQGTINLPNLPVFTIKYTNELRNGTKDSTIWGDTDFTGLPNNTPPISQVRKIVPGYLQLDERHEALEASMRHTVGNTSFEVTLLGDKTNNLDTRYVTRFPGEAKPFPTPPATILQPAAKMNNQVVIQQSDGNDTRTNAIIAKLDTVISDKLTFHLGGRYQHLDSDVSGDRPLVTSTPTATGVKPITTATFLGLTGGSTVKEYVGNAALDFKPTRDLFIKVALRYESEDIQGASAYTVQAASGNPAVTVTSTPRVDWSKTNQHSATPVEELRYTGIPGVALYFTGSQRNLNGDEQNTASYNPLTAANGLLVHNNNSENHGDYTLGANWRACSFLSLRAELFDKHHQYESTGYDVNLGDYYLLDSQFKGVKLTAIVQPLPQLSSTTRYIQQKGTMQVTGFLPIYAAYDSCDAQNYNLSETIDWAPSKAFYVQVNGTVVYNTINTVYPRAGITPAAGTSRAFNSNNVLQNSNNNYVTGSVLTGFVAAKDVDVLAQYIYYKADNGDPYMATLTQPYGAAAEESLVTLGVKWKMDSRRILNAKIGYADSRNDTTGGFTNYHGPLAYISLDYAL